MGEDLTRRGACTNHHLLFKCLSNISQPCLNISAEVHWPNPHTEVARQKLACNSQSLLCSHICLMLAGCLNFSYEEQESCHCAVVAGNKWTKEEFKSIIIVVMPKGEIFSLCVSPHPILPQIQFLGDPHNFNKCFT